MLKPFIFALALVFSAMIIADGLKQFRSSVWPITHVVTGDNLAELQTETEATAKTLDANGAALQNGDTVTLIKDLDVKGANTTLKRGTTIKNIRLTNDPAEIDCPSAPIRGLVLKSCFVKKS